MKHDRILDVLVLLVVLEGFWLALVFSLWIGTGCVIIEQRPETKAPPAERREAP